MAGGGGEDNPVSINVTAMVDVIFCLCLFFMCSLHFKQLEGKIETWLPKDRGVNTTQVKDPILEEIRVFMRWNQATQATDRKVGSNAVGSDDALMKVINDMAAAYKKTGKHDFPVLIDALGDVPWKDVIHVMDLCKSQREPIERIEFAAPMEYAMPGAKK